MSKAFVPEDTSTEVEVVPPARPAERRPITPDGLRRLQDERAAIDPADDRTKARLSAIDRILGGVEVLAPSLLEGGAGFGCVVVVKDEHGVKRTYVLVGPDELDAKSGRVSAASPVGAALLGRRVGDVVEVERGDRVDELEIVDVSVPI